MLQLHLSLDATRVDRSRRLRSRRRRGQQLVEPSQRDAGLDPLIEHTRELLQRVEELVEVEQEGDQQAGGERALADEASAVPQRDRLGDGAQQLAAGEVDRHQLHRLQPSVAVALRAGREPRSVVVVATRATA